MKKIMFLSVLIFSTSLLFGKTLVTVNGHKIDDSIIPKGYEQLDDEKRASLMEHVIKEELIHAELLKSSIVRDPKFQEVFEKQKRIAEKEYKRASGKSMTKAQIRNIKGSIALMLYQQREYEKTNVSNREVRDFYNNNIEKFNYPDSIEIANIIVQTEQEAKNIIKKLKNSTNLEQDFIKMAREHKQNGYMGWFGRGTAPQNLFNSAFHENPKKLISTPVRTKYGYHVIYLLGKKHAGKLSFNEAKKNIKDMLKKKKVLEKLQEKVDTLYGNSEIVY